MRERAAIAFRHASDAFVLVLLAAGAGEAVLGDPPGDDAVLAGAAVLWALPLLARRRFPLAAPFAVFAVLVAAAAVEPGGVTSMSGSFGCVLFAFWAAGVNNPPPRAAAGLVGGYLTLAAVTALEPDGGSVGDFFWIAAMGTFAWMAGAALYRRAEHARFLVERARRAEHDREARAQAAVEEERARIARELHDVVAHGVSVMTIQAAGVRRLLQPDQERERDALLDVERTGRQALADMRHMLGMLRRAEDGDEAGLAPQPGLDAVGRLLEQARGAGLSVDLDVEGEPVALPPGVDLSAYRIVQEALTNALRHAGRAHARVAVRYLADAVELEVSNEGDGGVRPADGSGQGLIGMRERVAVYGGELEAGPTPRGGFGVRARLPFAETAGR